MLEEERKYYAENLTNWLTPFSGKFALIKGRELIGTFDTSEAALDEGTRRFALTPFLIRPIQEQPEVIDIPALALGLLRADTTRPA